MTKDPRARTRHARKCNQQITHAGRLAGLLGLDYARPANYLRAGFTCIKTSNEACVLSTYHS